MQNQSPNNLPPQIQDFNIPSTNIIQWNIQGIANKKEVLVDLIAKEKPDVLCFQETMLSKQTNLNLKKYMGLFKKGQTNILAHGKVAIFLHETVPYQKIILKTSLQAIASGFNRKRRDHSLHP